MSRTPSIEVIRKSHRIASRARQGRTNRSDPRVRKALQIAERHPLHEAEAAQYFAPATPTGRPPPPSDKPSESSRSQRTQVLEALFGEAAPTVTHVMDRHAGRVASTAALVFVPLVLPRILP